MKIIEEGHVYRQRNGEYAGPMAMHPKNGRWIDQKGLSYDRYGNFADPTVWDPHDLIEDMGPPTAATGVVGAQATVPTGIELKENYVYKRRDGSFCGPMRRDWNQPKGFTWLDTADEYYTADGLHSLMPGANDPWDIVEEVGPPTQAVGKGMRAAWKAPEELPPQEAPAPPEAADEAREAPADRCYTVVQVSHVITLEEAQALLRNQPNPNDFAIARIAYKPQISFVPIE